MNIFAGNGENEVKVPKIEARNSESGVKLPEIEVTGDEATVLRGNGAQDQEKKVRLPKTTWY